MRKLTLKPARSRGSSDTLEVAPLPDRAQDPTRELSLNEEGILFMRSGGSSSCFCTATRSSRDRLKSQSFRAEPGGLFPRLLEARMPGRFLRIRPSAGKKAFG